MLMNCGDSRLPRPSMGSWVTYGLGTLNQNLPGFIVLCPGGYPIVSTQNWRSAFLPGTFQGTYINTQHTEVDKLIANIRNPRLSTAEQRRQLDLVRALNEEHAAARDHDAALEARIATFELAYRMQAEATDAFDIGRENAETREAYGGGTHGRQLLITRRLLERGVRFVQLFNGSYAMGEGVGNWDGHKKIVDQYAIHGPILDQPAAALLRDLRQRGLLDDTLFVFVTEFGRMPTFQKGANGRDHNPKGFTVWLAGAGVKRGFSYGATDEFGYQAVENVTTIYDLHATILHLLGLDHERLSFYNNGIERRLTDVHGHVIKDVLA